MIDLLSGDQMRLRARCARIGGVTGHVSATGLVWRVPLLNEAWTGLVGASNADTGTAPSCAARQMLAKTLNTHFRGHIDPEQVLKLLFTRSTVSPFFGGRRNCASFAHFAAFSDLGPRPSQVRSSLNSRSTAPRLCEFGGDGCRARATDQRYAHAARSHNPGIEIWFRLPLGKPKRSARNRTDSQMSVFQGVSPQKERTSRYSVHQRFDVQAQKATVLCDRAAVLPEVPCQDEIGAHHTGSSRFSDFSRASRRRALQRLKWFQTCAASKTTPFVFVRWPRTAPSARRSACRKGFPARRSPD